MANVDAIVVGSGPNGLAAAATLARAGLSVHVVEAARTVGGGTRSEPLTLPGFTHDVCSAVHPFAAASPFLSSLPLHEHGLTWVDPPIALAHPLDGGTASSIERDLENTVRGFGDDGKRYRALIEPFSSQWTNLAADVLAPLHVPSHPLLLARFGLLGLRSYAAIAKRFSLARTRAILGGIAAHGMQPLDRLATAAPTLLLAAAAHRVGWPFARGGSAAIAAAMQSYLSTLGVTIATSSPVNSLRDLPAARIVLLDLTPREVIRVAADRLPNRYTRELRAYQYGPGVFKVDWALSAPVPWLADDCRRAGTVHLGGTLEELNASEDAVARGEHAQHPFVLTAQPSCFDDTRAPAGKHVLWGYCHVPARSTVDMLPRIEAQIERFAPGFKDLILARHIMTTRELEARNANDVGGDISQGANTLRQLFFRPVVRANPYATPTRGLYLCSASTPPGAGVHGMCGYNAAKSALSEVFGVKIG